MKYPAKLTHEQRAERRKQIAAEVLESGASSLAVARKYRVSEALVRSACGEHGERPMYSRELPYKAIADMINTDDTLTEIGERHGFTATYMQKVYRRCLDAGIVMPKRWQGRKRQ